MNAIDFLTAAAQIGAGGPGPLPELDAAELWPRVLGLAIEHRVAPVLAEALALAPPDFAPPEVHAALDAELMRSSATRLLCEATLADAVRILRERSVEVIVLKGPTVAHTLYPRPELRIYHDLDLLCRVADYPVLHQALTAAGYTDAGTADARGTHQSLGQRPYRAESPAVRGFYDPSREMKLEVHFDALQLGLLDRRQEELWQKARLRALGGVEIRTLAPEHQFVHLAAHAHRHSYTRLSWLIEIDLLIRKSLHSMDWRLVSEVARDEGIGTMVRHALATANAVLGTPLPALPPPTLEERCLAPCYRALWPFNRTRTLDQREHRRLLQFLPDGDDARRYLYGLVVLGRRREKLRALLARRRPLPGVSGGGPRPRGPAASAGAP
jgi:hypothetical protein